MTAVNEDLSVKRDTALYTAWVAGGFTLLVLIFLTLNIFGLHHANPANNPELKQLIADLHETPREQKLRKKIRALDYALRVEYFQRQTFGTRGAWLAIAGAAVLFIALKAHSDLLRVPHEPSLNERVLPSDKQAGQLARSGVSIAAGIVLLATLGALLIVPAVLDFQFGGTFENKTATATITPDTQPTLKKVSYPSVEELKKQWASFRGFGGSGITNHKDIPLVWDGKKGTNILWKTPLPLLGKGSPIVWNNRLFLCGGSKVKRALACYSTKTGKRLWEVPFGTKIKNLDDLQVLPETTFAAPTPVTDGRRVYVIFATGDVAAVDFNGRVVWRRALPTPTINYGYASSLIRFKNILLVQFDQGLAEEGQSHLYGIDTETGKILYVEKRPVGASWSSPILARTASGTQIIMAGDPWLSGSDPQTGKLLWWADCLGNEHAPSPVFAAGKVYAVNAGNEIAAVGVSGSGEIKEAQFAWTAFDGLADIPSPLVDGKYVYMINTSGTASCYDAKTGKKYWEQEIKNGASKASPSKVGNLIYFISLTGETIIIKGGEKYEEVRRNPLGEKVDASPAFQDGRIYIRGYKHLFAISSIFNGAKHDSAFDSSPQRRYSARDN